MTAKLGEDIEKKILLCAVRKAFSEVYHKEILLVVVLLSQFFLASCIFCCHLLYSLGNANIVNSYLMDELITEVL